MAFVEGSIGIDTDNYASGGKPDTGIAVGYVF